MGRGRGRAASDQVSELDGESVASELPGGSGEGSEQGATSKTAFRDTAYRSERR